MKVYNAMQTPKVSIVIPAYNASNYLAEAIDSALAQTYPNIEIVVVNDGSRDDGLTEKIALSYGERVKYFRKDNGGSSSALNMGIANMTGEWFSWLSHDDLYAPNKVQRQMEYMDSLGVEPESLQNHIFFSAFELIDDQGEKIRSFGGKKSLAIASYVASVPHNGYLIAEPTKYNFHGCSCLIHRSAFERIGCFDTELRLLNDQDMWYRLYAANYKVHYIPEPLVKGRIHAKQVSKSIGFSYHNPEQDMFWTRSLNWILEHCPEEELLYRFGCNAYLKTRNSDGDRAFSYVQFIPFKKRMSKIACVTQAWIRQQAKKIYMRIKI